MVNLIDFELDEQGLIRSLATVQDGIAYLFDDIDYCGDDATFEATTFKVIGEVDDIKNLGSENVQLIEGDDETSKKVFKELFAIVMSGAFEE